MNIVKCALVYIFIFITIASRAQELDYHWKPIEATDLKNSWTILLSIDGKSISFPLTNDKKSWDYSEFLKNGAVSDKANCRVSFFSGYNDVKYKKYNFHDYTEKAEITCIGYDGVTLIKANEVSCLERFGTPQPTDDELERMDNNKIFISNQKSGKALRNIKLYVSCVRKTN